MMKKVELMYDELLKTKKTIINSLNLNKSESDLDPKIKNKYKKIDFGIACELFDKGYSISDVQRGLLKCGLYSKHIGDEKIVHNYCDEVMSEINKERILRAGKIFQLARESYTKKALAIQNKYSNMNFTEFQEGKVVISMMRDAGFFPEIIEAVLEKHSFAKNIDREYLKKVMDSCLQAKDNYIAIDAAKVDNLKTATDCYRLFAKEYMAATKTTILNGRDEQKIIARMFGEGLDEESIIDALNEASPVAVEPGRKKERYIETVLIATQEAYKKRKDNVLKNYPATLATYNKIIGKLDRNLKSKGHQGVDYNRSYYDGIAVKELLEKHHYISNIERVIIEASPQATKPNKLNPNKTPEGYAKWIRRSAQNTIAAEKAILDFSKQSSLSNGYTVLDLYKNAIAERIDMYPSTALNLSANYIDKDVCEKLLNQYPNIDLIELKKVIAEVSPRAQLPGIPITYPDMVLDETKERKALVEQKKNLQKTVRDEYMLQCGLASEGVSTENNMMMYHDGRAVLKMIQDGIEVSEIKSAIISGIKAMRVNVNDVEKYADQVIKGAEMVSKRLDKVKNYQASEENEHDKSDSFYIQQLKSIYNKKNYVSSSMDIAIVTTMLAKNFKESEVFKTIERLSPTAAEPGRDNKYQLFVVNQAKEKLAQEEIKLKQYNVIPRIDHECEAEKEYLYHKTQIQNSIKLPITEKMDVMIATALLQQGFKEKEITQALKQSPCNEKANYGSLVLKCANKIIDKDKNLDLEISLSPKI